MLRLNQLIFYMLVLLLVQLLFFGYLQQQPSPQHIDLARALQHPERYSLKRLQPETPYSPPTPENAPKFYPQPENHKPFATNPTLQTPNPAPEPGALSSSKHALPRGFAKSATRCLLRTSSAASREVGSLLGNRNLPCL